MPPNLRSRRPSADAPCLFPRHSCRLVELVACHLVPGGAAGSPWLSRPLGQVPSYYAESSVGAAHWCQLSKALTRRSQYLEVLRNNRRHHRETQACCRVLECKGDQREYDWPLAVLKLRASKQPTPQHETLLSHATPIARHTLRMAYWAVAKEVHPDRLQTPLAGEAMAVLNEAYRQAVLQFSERVPCAPRKSPHTRPRASTRALFSLRQFAIAISSADEVIRLDALGLEHAIMH